MFIILIHICFISLFFFSLYFLSFSFISWIFLLSYARIFTPHPTQTKLTPAKINMAVIIINREVFLSYCLAPTYTSKWYNVSQMLSEPPITD